MIKSTGVERMMRVLRRSQDWNNAERVTLPVLREMRLRAERMDVRPNPAGVAPMNQLSLLDRDPLLVIGAVPC